VAGGRGGIGRCGHMRTSGTRLGRGPPLAESWTAGFRHLPTTPSRSPAAPSSPSLVSPSLTHSPSDLTTRFFHALTSPPALALCFLPSSTSYPPTLQRVCPLLTYFFTCPDQPRSRRLPHSPNVSRQSHSCLRYHPPEEPSSFPPSAYSSRRAPLIESLAHFFFAS
jgi:hypothetical protein